MRILVTGANGFIGQHCIKQLRSQQIDFLACSHTNKTNNPELNICDICNTEELFNTLKKYRPTHVLHLAWAMGENYAQSPANINYLKAGIQFIQMFYELGGKKFVGVGTCYEYSHDGFPCSEVRTSNIPITLYGKTKLALAHYLQSYSLNHNVASAWCRLFYLLGPGEPTRRLVPSACLALLHNNIFSTAACKRILDYMDVRDAARALIYVLLSDYSGILNIASGKGTQIGSMLSSIEKIYNKYEQINCQEGKNKYVDIIAECTILHKRLLFKPYFSLQQSLLDCTLDLKERIYGHE